MGFGTQPPETIQVRGEEFPLMHATSPIVGDLGGGRGLKIAQALKKSELAETIGTNAASLAQLLVFARQAQDPGVRRAVADAFRPFVEADRKILSKVFGRARPTPSGPSPEALALINAGFSGGTRSALTDDSE